MCVSIWLTAFRLKAGRADVCCVLCKVGGGRWAVGVCVCVLYKACYMRIASLHAASLWRLTDRLVVRRLKLIEFEIVVWALYDRLTE